MAGSRQSCFPGSSVSLADAVVLQVGGDEAETLLSYGVIDQLQPRVLTEPGTDPLAVGVRLLALGRARVLCDPVRVYPAGR